MTTATKTKPAKKTPPFAIVTRTFKDGRTVHWYQRDGVNAKGRGVTTLLSNGTPSGGLVKWSANKAADCALDERDVWEPLAERSRDAAYDWIRNASDRDRDAAGGRGTEVHNLAEQLSLGQEVEVPDEIVGHVDAYIDWFDTWQPEIVATEVVGANFTRNYYGKFDLLVRVKGWFPGEPDRVALLLLDIKTARSGVFEKDALQLTAYRHFEVISEPDEKGACWDHQPMPEVDGVAVLHLSADGYRLVPVDPALDRDLFAMFLHASKIAEFYGSGWKAEDKGWSKDVFLPAHQTPHEEF